MAADNFNATLNLKYTPPGSPPGSGVAALVVAGTYQAGQSGSTDVPPGTVVGTAFAIPFGSVTAAKLFVIRNNTSSEISIKLNSSGSANFNIPAGGEFVYSAPTAPDAVPLTAVSFLTTVDPTEIERVLWWCFGD